ncbi:MAG: hypothetical protein HQ495_02295 [Alphaproteobacteria bacterium]|nr:hypothetical protein [Alphaproteobacteria bacterium]
MSPRASIGIVLGLVVLGLAGPAIAHGGSADPVPKGCHIVVEKVVINGVEIALRRVVCPGKAGPPTS